MKNPSSSFSFLFSFLFFSFSFSFSFFLAVLKFNSSQKHAFQTAHFEQNVQTLKDAIV